MKDTTGVSEGHGVANAEEQAQTVGERRDGFKVLVETSAFDKFHGIENAAVGERPDVVDGNNAGMLEASEDTGFAVEAMREVAVGDQNVEDLDGHAASKGLVFRGVNDTHATARDLLEQAITGSDEVGHIGTLTQTFEGFVGERFHRASEPNTARASR
jgi:hypothetical protein